MSEYKNNLNDPKGPETGAGRRKPRITGWLIPVLTGLMGLILGIALTVGFLPETGLFRASALGRYIDDSARQAVETAQRTILEDVARQLSAEEEQRQVIEETSEQPAMTVTEIVSQNKAAVVTVVAQIQDPELPEDYRNYIGTGFILNSDGLIATNYHVIADADELTVILSDGRELAAREINSDQETDLAIIALEEKTELPGIVSLGDSTAIDVGEQVVAIGSPVSRDFAGTVTSGILSGKDRHVYIDDSTISYLQTDAAINEGNSGGPLFNERGEVVGINTAKLSEDVQGIGFAIPINTLKEKLDFLSTVPLYSGMSFKNLPPEAYAALGIDSGVAIIKVDEGSPADAAGLKVQDIILTYDGQEILTTSQLIEIRERHESGDTVKVLIRRGDNTFETTLQLFRRP